MICYSMYAMSNTRQKKIQKKVYKYTAIFEQDQEVGGYTVTIPSLPGCISEGDTFEEALKNIQEAASLYLEVRNAAINYQTIRHYC